MTEREMKRDAFLSEDGLYRFSLSRQWGDGSVLNTCTFILNNPSTADANIDDPTVRRGIGFAKLMGCGQMIFVNLNPYRSTDPKKVIMPDENILRENDLYLTDAAQFSSIVICAWGLNGDKKLIERAVENATLYKDLHALALTKNGTPKHILYLLKTCKPILWKRRDGG